MEYLIQFNDHRAIDPDVVGQKFASLARAVRLGFAVPAGGSIKTEAHLHFIRYRAWPHGLIEEVHQFANMLGLSHGLSIRSSGVREDLGTQSFAGQYQSYLRIFEPDDLQAKIEKCWLSAESDTVTSYLKASRSRTETEGEIPPMGVILQRMVDVKAAGVAFGRNPVDSIKDEIVIEAVSGSAERLVNGHVSPHRAFVDKNGCCRLESPPEFKANSAAENGSPMTERDWLLIAQLLTRLETAIGGMHLDMEWAIDKSGKPWVLQYRGITTTGETGEGAPAGLWTRRIADDLWADRLTPVLSQSMVNNAERYNLSRALKVLNISVAKPTLAVINGYLYVNGESIGQLLAYLPGPLRTPDLRAFLPSGFDFDTLPRMGAPERLLKVLRGILLPIFEPSVIPFICLERTKHHWKSIERRISTNKRMPGQTVGEAANKVTFALETMVRIQENNQWPYFHAALFTMLLRWITVDLGGASHSDFLGLIGAGGRNISIDIERHFRQMVTIILQDAELKDIFLANDPVKVSEVLPPYFREILDGFLDRFGCRSRHRTLYLRRWAEAPEEVIGILQKLVCRSAVAASENTCTHSTQADRNMSAFKKKNAKDDHCKAAVICSGTKRSAGLRRLAQPWILRLARRFLDLRENLRFLLDKSLYEIRLALLQLGQVTGMGDDILFLYISEIKELVAGSLEIGRARSMAAERHRHFSRPQAAATFYIDGCPFEEFSSSSNFLKGIGTSPGRSTGRARIVNDPSKDPIQQGEILVAQNTDPGWTPILSLAAGMVMEEGGLLNHCSIVARELKIPAVVGIRQATRLIKNGAYITIDGGWGSVRIEEDPS